MLERCTEQYMNQLMAAPYKDTGSTLPQNIVSVAVDKETGNLSVVHLNKTGQVISTEKFRDIQERTTGNQRDSQLANKQQFRVNNDREKLRQYLEGIKPEVIVVSANCIQARKIKSSLMNFIKEKLTKWVFFSRDTVPQMVSKVMAEEEEYKEFEHNTRVAISLGRM